MGVTLPSDFKKILKSLKSFVQETFIFFEIQNVEMFSLFIV